ncbi:MAG: hypothetical protein GY795_43095 [Desulfobacterales bacterium]|nr:hypothetical protein [Desulfobacterales bacterium]
MSSKKLIRHHLYELLTDKTQDIQVFKSKYTPLRPEMLENGNAILIYTAREQVEKYCESPRTNRRILGISIELATIAENNADDVLDDLASKVEDIIDADLRLHASGDGQNYPLAIDAQLTETAFAKDSDGEYSIAFCQMNYDITYFTEQPDAVGLEDFQTADIKSNVDDLSAEDKVSLPQ